MQYKNICPQVPRQQSVLGSQASRRRRVSIDVNSRYGVTGTDALMVG